MGLYDPELEVGSRLESALIAVGNERKRQDLLVESGRFEYTCADGGPGSMSNFEKFTCLGEEFGEVAQEVLTQAERRLARDTEGTVEGLRKELTQVAAVAVAWIESLS